MKRILLILVLTGLCSCNALNSEGMLYSGAMGFAEGSPLVNNYGKTVLDRFDSPLGYTRVPVKQNTFASFLRTLELLPDGSMAHYYNGKSKLNDNNIYVAVVDLPISSKNIQMSASSMIRLVSEYLFTSQEYDKIAFHTEKQKISFANFSNGDFSKAEFHKYMDFVMERASTPSFCSDLRAEKLENIQIGDVFVQNNLPNGHVVIVVDMVENKKGEKLFLLAQGFRPAQEIQIISNPSNKELSPWYQLKEGELLTPEWRFMTSDLMRFRFLDNESK
ncbi:MAG: DUF4846 domain-containing protein [Moheibacter sp.]